MRQILRRLFERHDVPTGPEAPLPFLDHIDGGEAGEWLRRSSMSRFALNVGSLVPDQFEAYARIDHPQVESVAVEGELPRELVPALVEHLGGATTTRDECYFAVWEGFGTGTTVVAFAAGTSAKERREWWAQQPREPAWKRSQPTLELPNRRYHVFRGPIEGATTSLAGNLIRWQSANLWWPADHAWCVATEIDLAWTVVGASRACVDALIADPRLPAREIRSDAPLGA